MHIDKVTLPQIGRCEQFRFDSFGDFTQWLETTPRQKDAQCDSLDNSFSFTGTNTWEHALELARNGWPEHVSRTQQMSASLFSKLTSLIDRPQVSYDTEGIGIDISRYVDGEPECWIRFDNNTVDGIGTKHLRLTVNSMISASISTETIICKGSAIAALIEALEYSGTRVQLDAVMGYKALEVYVPIKHADQPIDLPRLLFALAHPSMQRRLCFGLLERLSYHREAIGFGYGGNHSTYDWTHPVSDKGDLYISHSYHGEPQWTSESATLRWCIEQIKKQGVHVHNESEILA